METRVYLKCSVHDCRSSLFKIHKSFIRPLLDYGDTINNEKYDSSFIKKYINVPNNAELAIIGAIRIISREKPYLELGLDYSR